MERQDLFLVRHPLETALTFRKGKDNTWTYSRLPQLLRQGTLKVLEHQEDGWAVRDVSRGAPGEVLFRPAAPLPHDPDHPPLGAWLKSGSEAACTLTADEPCISDGPIELEAEFAAVDVRDMGGGAFRIDMKINPTPINDESFNAFSVALRSTLVGIAQRPYATVYFRLDVQDAAVPPMNFVRRFMGWASENGWVLDMLVRGIAIALDAKGFSGYALLSVIKMVLRLLPAPWPNHLVPTVSRADAILAEILAAEEEAKPRAAAEACAGDASTTAEGLSPLAGSDESDDVADFALAETGPRPQTAAAKKKPEVQLESDTVGIACGRPCWICLS